MASDARTRFLYDGEEQFTRILFALVMADDGNLDFLFMAKILMVVHLARDERIGTCRDGITQQERTGSATERNLTDVTGKELIMLHAFHMEYVLQQ